MKTITLIIFLLVAVFQNLYAADELKFQITSEIEAYGPIFGEESYYSSRVVGLLFLPLVSISTEGEIDPILLEECPKSGTMMSDTSVKYSLKLRERVEWSDGSFVTAKDVIFTYELAKNNALLSANNVKDRLKYVKSMEHTGEYTFDVYFIRENQDNLAALYFKILPKNSFPNINPKIQIINKSDKFFQEDPVSNGLYKVRTALGNFSDLEMNTKYYDSDVRPNIRSIQIRQINEPSNIIQNFLYQDDINFNPDIPVARVEEISALHEFKVIKVSDYSFQFLAFNLRLPVFQDIKLREALTFAINKYELGLMMFAGWNVDILSGPFPTGPCYNGSVDGMFEPDTDKAKQLLDDNGYRATTPNGTRTKNGRDLKFKLLCKEGDDSYKNIATAFYNMYKDIGVEIEWEFVSDKEFSDRVYKSEVRDFEIALVEFKFGTDPNPETIFMGDYDRQGGFNVCGLNDEVVNELFKEARSKKTRDSRFQVYHQIHEKIAELCPGIFLWQRPVWIASHRSVEGLNPNTIDNMNIFKYIDQW